MAISMWRVRVNQNESELKHYGVLGMKWGVRKDREPTGRRKADTIKEFETETIKTKVTIAGTDTHDNYRDQLKEHGFFDRTNFYMPEAIASSRLKNLPKIENRSTDEAERLKVNDPSKSQK